jgi:hypothetical protein
MGLHDYRSHRYDTVGRLDTVFRGAKGTGPGAIRKRGKKWEAAAAVRSDEALPHQVGGSDMG